MATKILSSDKARAKWREVLDTAVAGDPVIIERYGNPVAVVISYADFVEKSPGIGEETAVYHIDRAETLKAQLLAEIKAALLADSELQQTLTRSESDHLKKKFAQVESLQADWQVRWLTLQQQLEQTEYMPGLDKEEIVTRLRQTRQEIFEAEYAHLY